MVPSRVSCAFLLLTTFILLLLSASACSAHSALLSANTFHDARGAHNSIHSNNKRTPHRYGRATLHGMSSGLSKRMIRTNYGGRTSDTRMTSQYNPQSRSLSIPNLGLSQSGHASGDACKVQFKGDEITFDGCSDQLEGEFQIFYNKNDTHIDTLFRAPGSTESYAALGWGCSRMAPCYAMIASVLEDKTSVDGYSLAEYSEAGVTRVDLPVPDKEISFENGLIKARFTRPLDSNTQGFPALSGDSFDFIWALGPFRSEGPQKHDTRQHSTLNIVDGTVSTVSTGSQNFRIAHAVVMSVSWLLFAPIAALAIRFFKKHNPITFRIHMSLAITTMLCTIIGVLLIVFKASHTRTTHMGFGYTILILVVMQVVGGLLRPEKSTSIRAFWFLLHRTLGPIVILLAFINIVIGIHVINGSFFWYVIVALVFLAHIILALLFTSFKRKFPTIQTERKASQSYAPSDPAEDSLVI